MVYLQTTYELYFGEAYFEYCESCDFSSENTNINPHLPFVHVSLKSIAQPRYLYLFQIKSGK
jgi:hypothetical protein